MHGLLIWVLTPNLECLSGEPKAGLTQDAVVGNFNLLPTFLRPLSILPCALGAQTRLIFGVAAIEQLVPDLEKEATVVGRVDGAARMMHIVLEAAVDEGMVGRDEGVFIAAV